MALADADGDLDTDGADFIVWQRQVGSTQPVAIGVPEPAAIALAALILPVLSQKRKTFSRFTRSLA